MTSAVSAMAPRVVLADEHRGRREVAGVFRPVGLRHWNADTEVLMHHQDASNKVPQGGRVLVP